MITGAVDMMMGGVRWYDDGVCCFTERLWKCIP